ncbi:MAG: MFS transporter [Bacteroidales bacterium]|nr:MFS transporter [Bacteroidales bacterium]
MTKTKPIGRTACWLALACLVVPMFGSYFFDDMFSSISFLFSDPSRLELGWDAAGYGLYTSGYSVLCVFGGLIVCGMLLDKWGVRITGSIFVGLMTAGAAMVAWAVSSGMAPKSSLALAYAGCMVFGLGSEIAGVAVTRSIARWFKDGPMAFAMGLQLAIARLGTAAALILAPRLVAAKDSFAALGMTVETGMTVEAGMAGETGMTTEAAHFYTLAETARPAFFGLGLLLLGCILWGVFVALDSRRFPVKPGMRGRGIPDQVGNDEAVGNDESFHLSDVGKILTNKRFLLISLLCVFFYSSIIAFKKFAGAILVPRFDVPAEAASWMVSMLPFATVIFAPLFGILVDKLGHPTRWMLGGAVLALIAHLLLAFAPAGVPFWGYLSMVFLGFGYSLVPAAMWPSVPKIVPDKVLGTAYSLIYWIQNLGLMLFKMLAGVILGKAAAGNGPVSVELMFVGVCIVALLTSGLLHKTKLS